MALWRVTPTPMRLQHRTKQSRSPMLRGGDGWMSREARLKGANGVTVTL